MKPHNAKLVVALLAVGLGACSRSPQSYVDAGNKFFSDSKLDDAILQYRKAIQGDSRMAEAHYRLGLALEKKPDPVGALAALERAVELAPGNMAAKVELADLSLVTYLAVAAKPTKYYNQVVKLSSDLLAADPNSFDGLRLKGSIAMIDHKPADAVQFFKRAERASPLSPKVMLDLSQALLQTGQKKEAEAAALGVIQRDPAMGPAYDLLYLYYMGEGRVGDAEELAKRKASSNPKQADYLLGLARHYLRVNRPVEMRKALEQMLAQPAAFPNGPLQVAEFYGQVGDFEAAFRLYDEGARAHPNDSLKYQKGAVNVLIAQGKAGEAETLVAEILKRNPDDADALAVRGSLRLEKRDPALLPSAMADLETAAKQLTDSPMVFYALGRGALARQDFTTASKQFAQAVRLKPNMIEPRLLLAEISLIQNKPVDAMNQASAALSFAPGHPLARLQIANAQLALGRNQEGRKQLNEILRDFPKNRDAQSRLGLLNISEKKYKEAEAIFRALGPTGDPRGLAGLSEVYSAQQQYGKAIENLQRAVAAAPNSPNAHGLLGLTALQAGNTDLAIEQYKWLMEKSPGTEDAPLRLGQAYILKNDFAQAATVLRKAHEADPKNALAASLLGFAQQSQGMMAEARANYKKALAINPKDAGVMNNLAFLEAEAGGDLAQAMDLLRRATVLAPKANEIKDTLGWVYLKQNQVDSALQVFTALAKAEPDNAGYRYHLGAALMKKGDAAKARGELQAALANKPSPSDETEIRRLLGQAN